MYKQKNVTVKSVGRSIACRFIAVYDWKMNDREKKIEIEKRGKRGKAMIHAEDACKVHTRVKRCCSSRGRLNYLIRIFRLFDISFNWVIVVGKIEK